MFDELPIGRALDYNKVSKRTEQTLAVGPIRNQRLSEQ
jgi:hypothetical protein